MHARVRISFVSQWPSIRERFMDVIRPAENGQCYNGRKMIAFSITPLLYFRHFICENDNQVNPFIGDCSIQFSINRSCSTVKFKLVSL